MLLARAARALSARDNPRDAEFELLADRRPRAPRPPHAEPRRRRDAGVHAGGHLRHRQGRDAASRSRTMGAQIILGNTFHLWLRPGLDVLRQFGGLHRFEGWTRPMLTDSGGFQVWSPGRRCARSARKACASPRRSTATSCFLTPEVSMQIQTVLNSDIVMQFDECTPYETEGRADDRGRGARVDGTEPALGAAQPRRVRAPGATRTRCSASCRAACSSRCARNRPPRWPRLDLPGYAIGGVSVGEPKEEMLRIMAHTPHASAGRTSRAT